MAKSFIPTDLQRVVMDASNGTSKYSNECMDAVRNAIKEACGGTWNRRNFLKNRHDVFAVIEEIMPVASHESLANKFGNFADFKDEAMGDETAFWVEDNTIYEAYACARGTQDVERQKIVDRNFKVPTENVIVKFYDEFDRFMAGKIDMGRIVSKAITAYDNHVGKKISDAIYDSYGDVGASYKTTGSFVSSTMATMIEHVKAATSSDTIQIWGTTSALGNISDSFGYSNRAKDEANGIGYYGTFRGVELISLPQGYTAGQTTPTFAVNNDFVIILPVNEPIVKVVFEGEPVVDMKDALLRNDLQPEFVFIRRIGAAALTLPEGKYGIYKFS